MRARDVTHPVPWRSAFERRDGAALLSRAALLVLLGTQLRGDVEGLRARAAAAGTLRHIEPLPRPDVAAFPVREQQAGGAGSHSSLLGHGTFARQADWWQPGGAFHQYVSQEVRPDLYGAQDRFDWSGGWSDTARDLAAADLVAWVGQQGLGGLDLFTHSHGGNVAMLASQHGLDIGSLVLLSCPVHADRYMPDFTRVAKVVSVRVHLDLVILLDGGGQRFRHPQIHENVLPLWFDHSATHEPDVWRQYNVPAML